MKQSLKVIIFFYNTYSMLPYCCLQLVPGFLKQQANYICIIIFYLILKMLFNDLFNYKNCIFYSLQLLQLIIVTKEQISHFHKTL